MTTTKARQAFVEHRARGEYPEGGVTRMFGAALLVVMQREIHNRERFQPGIPASIRFAPFAS